MQELIELALKRLDLLEKKVEKYFSILKVDNELDFIFKGTYITEEDIEKLMEGKD